MAGGETRPRVYFELARICFHAVRANNPRPSPAEVEPIWTLLESAAGQRPPLVKVYELMAEMAQSAEQVSPRQLDRLAEGVRLFPHHVALLETVARLHVRADRVAEAQSIMQLGLTMNPDPASQRRLARLQAELMLI